MAIARVKNIRTELSLAGQLLYNAGRYRVLKRLRLPGKIEALSLEITHRCICRCVMCNIWKIPKDVPELDMKSWASLLGSPSFSHLVELDITGGEPFLKEDLPVFFENIKALHQCHLRRLRSIAITTNAVLTSKVLNTTESILKILESSDIQLVLACAMDAVDSSHDRIRNYPGAFERMQATLSGLMELRKIYPQLVLGIKTTILPDNVQQLQDIDRYAKRHDLFSIISPCIITTGRYLNQDLGQNLLFSKEHFAQMIDFFEHTDMRWSYHARMITEYLKSGCIHRLCSCGMNYAFIRSSGDVHLCPLLPLPIGSVLKSDFADIWRSSKAKMQRGQLGCIQTCRHCTEPGLERYSLYYEGWSYFKMLVKMGRKNFNRFHEHMGFGNYFR
jgi:MoaA/NifB/PqqE/SkfB family radical SAM enzyme